MTTSESTKEIFEALAAAQGDAQNVAKDKQGYGYRYSSLDSITEMLRPILAKNGLAVMHSEEIADGAVTVETIVTHKSGEWVKVKAVSPYNQLKGMNDYQSIGAALTYLRRYSVASLFNIASDEDIDVKPSAAKQRQSANKAQPAAQRQETLSDYLKRHGVDAKRFCAANQITNAEQAQALLADKGALDEMIARFKGVAA